MAANHTRTIWCHVCISEYLNIEKIIDTEYPNSREKKTEQKTNQNKKFKSRHESFVIRL